jgi:hypothetical protein
MNPPRSLVALTHVSLIVTTLKYINWKNNTNSNNPKLVTYAWKGALDVLECCLLVLQNLSIWELRQALLLCLCRYIPNYVFLDGIMSRIMVNTGGGVNAESVMALLKL